MTGEQRVRVEVADHVATVALTRADKHNALDVPMFEQIIAAADRWPTTSGVRAVVLHGDGPSFCSGLDVVSIMARRQRPGRPCGAGPRRGAQLVPARRPCLARAARCR